MHPSDDEIIAPAATEGDTTSADDGAEHEHGHHHRTGGILVGSMIAVLLVLVGGVSAYLLLPGSPTEVVEEYVTAVRAHDVDAAQRLACPQSEALTAADIKDGTLFGYPVAHVVSFAATKETINGRYADVDGTVSLVDEAESSSTVHVHLYRPILRWQICQR